MKETTESKVVKEILEIIKANNLDGASVRRILRAVQNRFLTEAKLVD